MSKSACWAITISPFNFDLEVDIEDWLKNSTGVKYWSGVVEDNGESGIRHAHLAVAFTSPRFYQSVHKSFMKHVKACEDFACGKLTRSGVKVKVWYNDDWVKSYPQGEMIGMSVLPDDLDYLPKGDTSFVKPPIKRWHDVVLDLWDTHIGVDAVPKNKEDVSKFLSYIMYQTREIAVIERFKYNGRVVEIFEFLCKRHAPPLLDKVEVERITTIKEVIPPKQICQDLADIADECLDDGDVAYFSKYMGKLKACKCDLCVKTCHRIFTETPLRQSSFGPPLEDAVGTCLDAVS